MYNYIITTLKSLLDFSLRSKYHIAHLFICKKLLLQIEKHNGRLSNRKKKLCRQYAIDVLGHIRYAPWLYVYTALSGDFQEGWIPDNYYGAIVVPILKGSYGRVSSLKTLNSTIFRSNAFPDILSYANGVFFDINYRYISADNVVNILFSKYNKVVYKLDNSSQGRSIYFFTRDNFILNSIYRLGNGLFQGYIRQHETLALFAEESVATIRITTVYEDSGEVSIRACYLRFGSERDTHIQSMSHIRVPIEINTGHFYDVGYTAEWNPIQEHPTSTVRFSGKTIPYFNKCVAVVTELHKKVPYARVIGWDATIDCNGTVRLMEWNAEHNDIKFSEATQGPCFSDLGWDRLPKMRYIN